MTDDTADAFAYNWLKKFKRPYTDTIYTSKRAWKYNLQTSSFQAEGENFSITSKELDKVDRYWLKKFTLGTILNKMYDDFHGDPYKSLSGLGKLNEAFNQGEQKMSCITLSLSPILPFVDPCNKENADRPFTQQEIARAVADLVDFIAGQEVFSIDALNISKLEQSPISPITE